MNYRPVLACHACQRHWQTCTRCIGKCHLPSFCSPRTAEKKRFSAESVRRKQKQSVDFHITFSNKLRPSPPSSWRGWCWCERIVNIFSFTPSGATRPCAALIIVLFFSLSFPPNVQYSVRFFLERLFFSCLFIFYPENAIAGSMRLIFFYCVWNYVNGLQLVLEDLSSITF